jgi:hypothetical protein
MTTTDEPSGARDQDVLAVATAMLRYALPDIEEDGIRLETSQDADGIWLRLIRPPGGLMPSRRGDTSELMLIDSVADNWGTHGGTDLPSILWALLR